MKRITCLLLLFPLLGCQQSGANPLTLKPVVVDEAAAYPSQESGTKPPILTGFTSLSKEDLDNGWVQLFDGISTFGWEVAEGDGTLSVMTDGSKNYLVFDQRRQGKSIVLHRFSEDAIIRESNVNTYRKYAKECWFTECKSTTSLATAIPLGLNRYMVYGLRAKPHPHKIQPLTESDWKPAAGKCEAKWTDGVLELTGGSGMVESVKEYGDFILQLEYFTEKKINSGVFFRCIPGENMNGYECQIFNAPPEDDYKKFIGTDTGGIFRRQVGRNVGPKDGEWNYLTIAAQGAKIATWVNGIQVTDWEDTRKEHANPRNGLRLEPGTIQLQGHDPGTKILFRHFRITEIK